MFAPPLIDYLRIDCRQRCGPFDVFDDLHRQGLRVPVACLIGHALRVYDEPTTLYLFKITLFGP